MLRFRLGPTQMCLGGQNIQDVQDIQDAHMGPAPAAYRLGNRQMDRQLDKHPDGDKAQICLRAQGLYGSFSCV